nr:histone deacetylase 1/2 [Cryptococcus depauperatus CBS 7841]
MSNSIGCPRVSYIWSSSLQRFSDELPSNIGRSNMVHGLIHSLGMLDFSQYDEAKLEKDGENNMEEEESMNTQKFDHYGQKQPSQVLTGLANGSNERKAIVRKPDTSLGTKASLLRYHDKLYIEQLLKADVNNFLNDSDRPPSSASSTSSTSSSPRMIKRTESYNLSYDNPLFPSLPSYICLVASATSTACRLLAQDKTDWALCWDGGRHHAKRKEAGGFCYVNDLVLGALLLCREGRISVPVKEGERTKTRPPRILYLDMDLHYGDGVAAAFHSPTIYPFPIPENSLLPKPPNVLTLSVHHSSPIFFPPPTPLSLLPSPDTQSPFSLSIPLSAYPTRSTYQDVFTRCIQPIQKAWNPDYVIVQLGTDGLPADRVGQYGNWSVERQGGMKWMMGKIRQWNTKICVTGGGGYQHNNAARAWAEVTALIIGRPLEEDMAVPHHEHFEQYAPSFTMQIPEGHMRDENTKEGLDNAAKVYAVLAERIKAIVQAHS